MRRKGTPCACECDPCKGKNYVRAVNNVSPDPNGDFEIAAGENVTISETEYGIEISAQSGGSSDAVKSVNGELPDQDGDVTVDTGVMTVNGVSADADGEFTVSGGQNVTVTETVNGIEISAEGGSPEAVAPIYIDQDGKIALKDWVLVTSTDWTIFLDANDQVTEDLLVLMSSQNLNDDIYIPKGALKSTLPSNSSLYYDGNSTIRVSAYNQMYKIFNNANNVNIIYANLSAYSSNSGTINETYNVSLSQYSAGYITKITDPSSTASGIRLFRRA